MDIFRRVLSELNSHDVRYVVVGGYAVVLHGHMRMTLDLDLVVALDPENARKAIGCLESLGMFPRLPVPAVDFADEAKRNEWVNTKGAMVFTMLDRGIPFFAIDLFLQPPIAFDELIERAVTKNIGGVSVPISSVDDLIRMKELSGRGQDLADIEALKEMSDEET